MATFSSLPPEIKSLIVADVAALAPQDESMSSSGKDLASLRLVDRSWSALVAPVYFKLAELNYRDFGPLETYLALIAPRYGDHVKILTFGSDHPCPSTPPRQNCDPTPQRRVDAVCRILRHLPNLVDVDLELGLAPEEGVDDSRLLRELPAQLRKLHLSGPVYMPADEPLVAEAIFRLPHLRTLNLRDVSGTTTKIQHLQIAIRSLEYLRVLQFESTPACNVLLLQGATNWQPPLETLNIYHCPFALLDFQRLTYRFRSTLRNIFLVHADPGVPANLPSFDLPHLFDLRIESYLPLPFLHTFNKCPLRYLFIRIPSIPTEKLRTLLGEVWDLLNAHKATLKQFKLAVEDRRGNLVALEADEKLQRFSEKTGIKVEFGHWDAWEDPGLHG